MTGKPKEGAILTLGVEGGVNVIIALINHRHLSMAVWAYRAGGPTILAYERPICIILPPIEIFELLVFQ